MPNNGFSLKIDLPKADRERNLRIFGKVVEAIILPVFIGILLGWGSWITILVAIVWWGLGVYGLFTNWEDFIIQVILKLLGIIN